MQIMSAVLVCLQLPTGIIVRGIEQANNGMQPAAFGGQVARADGASAAWLLAARAPPAPPAAQPRRYVRPVRTRNAD